MRDEAPTYSRASILRAMAAAALTPATLGAVSACSASNSSSSPGAGDAVNITYGLWAEEFRPAFQEAADAFTKQNPSIKVTIQVTPFDDYFTKLNAAITSKTAPDAFWLQNIHIDLYARNGALADLTEFRSSSKVDLGGVPESIAAPYTIGGKLYGMPWQTLPFGLYYNKALFSAKGVAEPTNDWTWDDVTSAARALTDPTTGVYGIAAPVWNYGTFYHTMYQSGADIISADKKSTDFDSQAGIEGLEIWAQFAREGLSPSPAQFSDTNWDSYFTSAKVAMVASGPWVAATYIKALGDDVRVVEMPTGKVDTTGYATTITAVAASSPNAPAAFAFAEFLESVPGQKILGGSGTAGPGVNTDAQQAWLDAVPGIGAENLLSQIPRAKLLPSSLNTAVWEDEESKVLTPAWAGTAEVSGVASSMADVIRKALAAE